MMPRYHDNVEIRRHYIHILSAGKNGSDCQVTYVSNRYTDINIIVPRIFNLPARQG